MIFKYYQRRQYAWSRCRLWAFSGMVSLLALFALLAWLLPDPLPALANDKITADLQTAVNESNPDERLRFIVHLQESADFSRTSLPTDKVARRTMMVQQLQETAVSSQAALLTELDNWQGNGRITSYRPFWIINAVAVEGTADIIQQIADRPEVKQIELDSSMELIPPPAKPEHEALFQFIPANPPTEIYSWGIDRIRAPHVWHGLGYDGSAVTVAIMDSGVDWLHPDLFPNYRGNLGNGMIQHAGNWFNAAIPTMTVPIDFIGHGTHVAGTAVGQNGIGVAPGAKWIGVSITDPAGFIFNSYIHAGFEWFLAPNGNPGLAPDVINGSWGGPGANDFFLEDVETLHTAGIITVFSAGNTGPFDGSIQMPASYTDTIAIGASDIHDELAWFSSRGPSTFTSETHPHIIAPGTVILSAFPGNLYAYLTGTSMSAPHVTGAIALLLSASPSLSPAQAKQTLLTTAVPTDPPHPNNGSGWGRLDIYTAVSQGITAGTLQGTIQSQGIPTPGLLFTLTTQSGDQLPFMSDENGHYEIKLQPGVYALTINVFGYIPYSADSLTINTVNQTVIHNVNLTTLPAGTFTGFIRTSGSGTPLAATIKAEGTPIIAETDSNGYYTLTLPEGKYDLVVQAIGRRLGQITLTFIEGQTQSRTIFLAPGPAILLVDSGQWYYNSQISYYQNSLENLDYSYQLWEIRDPYTGAPLYSDMQLYDTIIWSAPEDSPGIVSAGAAITHFLKTGGHLFVSGQDVARYENSGAQRWWYRDLEAQYTGSIDTDILTGAVGTLFEGLTITLNGIDSAQNQIEPDTSKTIAQSLTQPVFRYGDGRIGGLQRSRCQPFRLVYLGFGLEGVTGAVNRQAILDRTFDYFNAPRIETGLRWLTNNIDDFALPNTQLVYTITMQNLSETITDTFQFQIENAQWASSLITSSVSVGPCQIGQTVLTVDVPTGLTRDAVHTMQVTAVSTNAPTIHAQLQIRHKTPGQILFVDDDRWYDQKDALLNSLDQMGLVYDTWETGWIPGQGRGSPSAELLQAYDFIIWYTGYDWYQPLTNQENAALYDYLSQGGRLFLTSQDYLYYHAHQSVAKDFFGLLTYQESITPTQVYAGNTSVVPNKLAGPVPLTYGSYLNFSDGIIPTQMERVVLWGDQGMAAGISNQGVAGNNQDWRLVFWSIPFETMTTTAYLPAMNGIMGWLGDLGNSTFVVDKRSVASGVPQTYTLTLKNLPSAPTNHLLVTNTLPAGLAILPETITGGAVYDAGKHQLTWEGDLLPGMQRIIRYQAVPNGEPRLDNQVIIYYERHKIAFNQTATVWVDAPDLSDSQLTAVANTPSTSPLITYSLHLQNDGFVATNGISAVVRLPDAFYPLTDTLNFDSGTGFLTNQHIHWRGDLLPDEAITITLQLSSTLTPKINWHSATAVVQDGVTDTQLFYHLLPIRPFTYFWPFIANQ